jgi:hypothetical protein
LFFTILGGLGEYLELRGEGAEGCRRLHNEELHILYTSPNVIRVNKSRRMMWAGHLARMER